MKVLQIGWNSVRRLLREPSNVFFVFIFPMLMIIVLGVSFGGEFKPRLGVVVEADGPFSAALLDHVTTDDSINVDEVTSVEDLSGGVERGRFNAGLVVPDDYDQRLAAGEPAVVGFVGRASDIVSRRLLSTSQAAISEENIGWVAVAAIGAADADERTTILATADSVRSSAGDVRVVVSSTGEALFPETLGQFDLGASQQLLLFVFLTSMAGSVALIQSRQWGVTRRMVSTPTSTGTIIGGEALGRYLVALVQGVFIMLGSLLLFGVNWGDPSGAAAILLFFCAVGAGAGMLVGSIATNDQQAGSFGVFASLGIAAIGGCMVPIEFFPETMQRIAHLTPHAWGLDAFAELVRHNGTIADIALELTILAGFALVLLSLASWRLRKTLTG